MQTHPWTLIWPQLGLHPASDKALSPATPTVRTHPRQRHTGTCPLLLLDCQRQKVTSAAHTPHSPGSQAHNFTALPSTSTAPLPAQHPCPDPSPPYQPHRSHWVLTAHMQHSHTCPTGRPHSWVLPKHQHCPAACQIPSPTSGPSYLGFASESTPNKTRTAGLGKVHRLSSRSMLHRMVQIQH